MSYIQKLFSSRVNNVDGVAFVGEEGRLWWDPDTNAFYYSDGVTPGGIKVGTGSFAADLTAVQTAIIPDKDEEYDLGSPDLKFRDLYLSGNSLHMGNTTISVGPSGLNLPVGTTIDGSQIGTTAGIEISETNSSNALTNVVTNLTAIRFDKDTGFNVTDLGSGEVKVSLGSSFKTWQVEGQEDVVAVGEDTMKLIAGEGIEIATNPSAPNKSITVSSFMTWASKNW